MEPLINQFDSVGIWDCDFRLILGTILAIGRTYWSFPLARLMDVTAWVLLITPSFILAQGWVLFANPNGLAAKWLGLDWVAAFIFQPAGLIFIMTLCKFSLAYLAVVAALEWNVSHFADAARLCGGKPLTVWRTVQVPLMMPALVAGWALVFMDTIGDFGLPAALSTVYNFPTLPYSIYSAIYTSPIRFDMAGVLALYLVLILVIAMGLLFLSTRKSNFDFLNERAAAVIAKPLKKGWMLTGALLVFILFVLGVPVGSSVLVSFMKTMGGGIQLENLTFGHYVALFSGGSGFLLSLKNSLLIAVIAAICSTGYRFFLFPMSCVLPRLNTSRRSIFSQSSRSPYQESCLVLAIFMYGIRSGWRRFIFIYMELPLCSY